MSPLELLAVALGLANIGLLVARSVWNYPFAMAMVSLYAVVFWRVRLYSDALLQLFFLVVNAWGWRLWHANRAAAGTVVVRTMPARLAGRWAAGAVPVILLWGGLEAGLTDAAYSWLDATVAALSIVAQILLAKRYLENWLLWIVVDLLSILLYGLKGLQPTMALYALFLLLAGWGWIAWRRALTRQEGRTG